MGIFHNQTLIAFALIYSLYGFSLHVTLKAGVFSLANAGFAAIGGYTSAIMVSRYSAAPAIAIAVGVILAVVVSIVVVFPLLRIRGIYLALLTFSFGQLVLAVISNAGSLTKGTQGILVPQAVGVRTLFVAVVVVAILLARLEHSRFGRTLDEIRLDESLAEAMGVPVRRYVIGVFVLSAAPAGLAGAFWAQYTLFITPDNYNFGLVVNILLYTVIGGSFLWAGPIVGSFFLVFLAQELNPLGDWSDVLLAALMIAVVLLWPSGIASGFVKVGRAVYRRIRPPMTSADDAQADVGAGPDPASVGLVS